MHTGNQPPFAGGLAQQDLPGTPGLFRIDVEGDRGFWPRRLNGREMDDIPPDQQRGIARFETIPGMPGRMAWTAPQKLDTQLSKVQFYG